MNAQPLSDDASLPPARDALTPMFEHSREAESLPPFDPFVLSTPEALTIRSPADSSPDHEPERWRPSAPAGPVLAESLLRRWEGYQTQLRNCQACFSEEGVHELRVATRRLIAQFVMLDCVAPGGTADLARRMLKRRLKTLGALRDAHVQRAFVERQMTRFPELMLVRDFLQSRELKLEKAAAAQLRRFGTGKLEEYVWALEQRLVAKPARRPDRLTVAVARAASDAFAEVVCRRRAIDPAVSATIHRTRVAFKKFRYMVEALSPDLTGLGKRDLRALAYYQRRMGNLQDLEVLQQCLAGFEQRHAGMEILLRPFTRYLRARRARAQRSFLKSADQVLGFWPPNRSSPCAETASARQVA